jgi:hypothetical protein
MNNLEFIKMKNIVYFIAVILMAGCLANCNDMDSNYKDFLVPNGIIYPQRVENPTLLSGLYRVQIVWAKTKDPKVIRSRIYWNNYTDSLSIDNLVATNDTFRVNISPLTEGNYTFYIKNFDADGNVSIPTEVSGQVYGENYIVSLSTWPVTYEIVESNSWTVKWGSNTAAINGGATAIDMEYTIATGTKTVRIPVTESKTVIRDAVPGGDYRYRTLYVIPKCIDTFYTGYTENTISSKFTEDKIPSGTFKNARLPGDFYTQYASAYPLENVWDNNISNIYATVIPTPFPNHFTINLGHTIILTRFKLFPRTSHETYTGAGPRFFEIWGTDNPPADGSFDNWHKLGEWEQPKPSGYGQGADVGPITSEDKAFLDAGGDYIIDANNRIQVKYLRVVINHCYASYGGNSNMNMVIAEMEFYGGIFDE